MYAVSLFFNDLKPRKRHARDRKAKVAPFVKQEMHNLATISLYPMLKERKRKVNDPCSAIAVYACVSQSLIRLVS
jgi:hypothetical protein